MEALESGFDLLVIGSQVSHECTYSLAAAFAAVMVRSFDVRLSEMTEGAAACERIKKMCSPWRCRRLHFRSFDHRNGRFDSRSTIRKEIFALFALSLPLHVRDY